VRGSSTKLFSSVPAGWVDSQRVDCVHHPASSPDSTCGAPRPTSARAGRELRCGVVANKVSRQPTLLIRPTTECDEVAANSQRRGRRRLTSP
jgi:hypothetical protein